MKRLLVILALFLGTPALADQSIALYGTPKYEDGFAHFDYVNPKAPKGGTLKLAYTANFDSMNPYILKGISAPGVTNYLYQSLMTPSYDEPQSFYPLIASSVTLSDDRSHASFTLNPKARWHDGKPITAEDVVFTFTALKEKGHPSYRILYKPISVEKTGERSVRFTFADTTQRELPILAATMPVLPKHFFCPLGDEGKDAKDCTPFDKTTLKAPLGSGPYKIAAVDPGRSVTYERVKDYWAKDLPSQVGFYNFDRIQFDVYRDDVVSVEGIKSHQFDFYEEFIARNWATAYDTPAVKSGALIKTLVPHKLPRGMQGFLFNTRLEKFADRRVREAIGLTLDFEWMNRVLFYGAYERNSSYFNNTDFAAPPRITAEEKALLEPYRKELPKAVFNGIYTVPTTDGSGYARANLIRAQSLLEDAGWVMKDGVRVNEETGEPLTVEFLMTQRTFERVIAIMRHNLKKLGIASTFRYVDASQYQKRVDKRNFDVISIWWNQGNFFPGSEQFTYWHSSQADVEGSQNLGGVKNKAIDTLVSRIQRAQSLAELRPAARALDRVLLNEHYVIPHWNINAWRVLYWNQFGKPEVTPPYNIALDSWWATAPDNAATAADAAKDAEQEPATAAPAETKKEAPATPEDVWVGTTQATPNVNAEKQE